MKLKVAKPAERQIERIGAWWRENRDKAPELFADELETAKTFLVNTPLLGIQHGWRKGRIIRKIVLPKTKVKLFYWVDEKAEIVNVISAWGGKRGRDGQQGRARHSGTILPDSAQVRDSLQVEGLWELIEQMDRSQSVPRSG